MKKSTVYFLILNAAIGAMIGAVFGALTNHLLPWLAGGIMAGGALAAAGELVFGLFGKRSWLYRRRVIFTVFIELLLVVYLLVPAYAAYTQVIPIRVPPTGSPADMGLNEYEQVAFTTEDGLVLRGWYLPSKNGAAVIALHGHSGNRSHMLPYAWHLAQHGYGVLMFDMRAHGESDGKYFAVGWDADRDVVAALDWLAQRPDVQPGRIGGLGLSSGAQAVLGGASRDQRLRALITEGTPAGRLEDYSNPPLPGVPMWFTGPLYWVFDRSAELYTGLRAAPPIQEQVKQIAPRPMLFIAGGQALYEEALANRYAQAAGPSAQVWVIPDAGHVGGIFAHPEEYGQRMAAFFKAALLDR